MREIVYAFVGIDLLDMTPPSGDGVLENAREMLILWHNYSTKANGNRLFTVWKLLMLATKCKNYAKQTAICYSVYYLT